MAVDKELAEFCQDPDGWDLPRFARFWTALVERMAALGDKPEELCQLASVPAASNVAGMSPESAYQHGLVDGLAELARALADPLVTDEARSEMSNPIAQIVMQALKEQGPMHVQRVAREIGRDPGQVQRVLSRMEDRGVLQHQTEGRRKVFSATLRGTAAWKDAQVRDGKW